MNFPKMVFRKKDGEIESKILHKPPIPKGWSDDLKAVKEGPEKVTQHTGPGSKKKKAKKKVS